MFHIVALAHRERVLAGLALALTNEKAAVRAARQQDLLRLATLNDAVEPVLGLDALDGGGRRQQRDVG